MAEPKLDIGINIEAQTGGARTAETALNGVKDSAKGAGEAVGAAAKAINEIPSKPATEGAAGVKGLAAEVEDLAGKAGLSKDSVSDLQSAFESLASQGGNARNVIQGINSAANGGVTGVLGFAKALQAMVSSAAAGNAMLGPLALGVTALVAVWSKAIGEIEADKAKFDELGESAEDASRRIEAAAKRDVKFDKLRAELSEVTSQFDRAVTAAERLQRAQDELKDAQLGAELKKMDAAKALAMASAGDDPAARQSIELRDSMAREQLRAARETEKAEAAVADVSRRIAAEKDKGIEIELRLNDLRRSAEESERRVAAARELLLRQGVNPDTLTDDSRKTKTDEFQRIYNQTYDRMPTTPAETGARSDALSNYKGVIDALQNLPELVKQRDEMLEKFGEADEKAYQEIRDTKDRIAELSVKMETALVGLQTAQAERAAKNVELQTTANKTLDEIRQSLISAQQRQEAALQAMAAANQVGDGAGAAQAGAAYNAATGAVNSLQGLLQQAQQTQADLNQTATSLHAGVSALGTATGQAAAAAMDQMAQAGATIQASGAKAAKDVAAGADEVKEATSAATGAISGSISQFGSEVTAAVDRTGQQFMQATDRLSSTIQAQQEQLARQQAEIEAAAQMARAAGNKADQVESQVRNMR
jgi:chromosome segregation ATPase